MIKPQMRIKKNSTHITQIIPKYPVKNGRENINPQKALSRYDDIFNTDDTLPIR